MPAARPAARPAAPTPAAPTPAADVLALHALLSRPHLLPSRPVPALNLVPMLTDAVGLPAHMPCDALGKTFDDLTPDEMIEVGMRFELEVLSATAAVYPAAPASMAPFGHLITTSAEAGSLATPPAAEAAKAATATAHTVAPTYECHWMACTRRFHHLHSLATHLQTIHVPRRQPTYPCLWQGCARDHRNPFAKRHKLVTHLRAHTLERPFVCTVCGRGFAREDSRDQHLKVHGAERQGPWGCACHGGRIWRTWRGVRRHEAGGGCGGVWRLAELMAAVDAPGMRDNDAAIAAGLSVGQWEQLLAQGTAAFDRDDNEEEDEDEEEIEEEIEMEIEDEPADGDSE